MTIPLMEGYLAVTGPNGSGKSNIADAILFVLGPKSSKAIRAGKLTDLIFDGGKSKNKADYTKVSLVFDNSDGILPWNDTTVRLTRHIRMAGNGEDYYSNFYINDQKSTMAEFDNLLSRARISAEGYNLVQQGDVTRIVQMGAIERRRILDGISGIASYDADIAKASGEKADAEANLDRISIILSEIDRQLEALKEDMDKARKYNELKSRLDIAKVQKVYRDLETQKAKKDTVLEYVAKAREEIESLKALKSQIIEKLNEISKSIMDVETEISNRLGPEYELLKKKITDIRVKIANYDDRVERFSDEITEFEGDIEARKEELHNTEVDIATVSRNIEELNITIDSKNSEKAAADKVIEEIGNELRNRGGEHKELQDKLTKVEEEIDKLELQNNEARVSYTTYENRQRDLSLSLAGVEEAVKDNAFEIKDAEFSLNEIQKEIGENGIETLSQKILDAKKREAELEKEESELVDAQRSLSHEYNQLMAEKKAMDKVRGNDAISTILELRDKGQLKGIHGTIAELASVDKEYELALSTAAGGKMQAIVVDNDQVAAEAMGILKRTNAGRATFLPLNKMLDGKPRARAIMVVKDTEGYAIDLIDFDEKYRAAFWYVFADTLVTKSLDDARRIMGNVRIVTKTGELIEASGAMVGGTSRPPSLKFGSASQGKLDEVSAKYRAANEALEDLRARILNIRDHIRNLDNELRQANTKSVDVQGNIGRLKAQIGELREAKKRLEAQQTQARNDLEANNKAIAEAEALVGKISAELEKLRENRSELKDRITAIAPVELQDKLETARNASYNLGNEIMNLQSTRATDSAELSGLNHLKGSIVSDIKSKEDKIAENKVEIEKIEADRETMKLELVANQKIESEMESGIQDLRQKKDTLTGDKFRLENDRNNANKDIESKEGYVTSQDAVLIECDGVIAQLNEEIAALDTEVVLPLPSEDELRRTINACQKGLDSLGAVNLRAIEDYEAKKERHDKLNSDVERLNAQIKELEDLTASLNGEKKGLFMKTYEGIDVNFREIYAELSGGGEAFMKLENEDDPFAGGLMINAKPRNGKLLRLEALSGGEKSLTALAFIFAIQEFQPSPFYVLDEVDMFLDSVNAEMVAKRVKESSAKAQFIQVSLRKVTLALAEHLIGVTRQTSGVSKVIMQPDLAEVSKYEEQAKAAASAADNNIEQ